MENVDRTAGQPRLRPYQQSVIERVAAEVDTGRRRILLVAPTGSGKTVIGARLAGDARIRGQRVVFLVHRRELVRQTSQKLHTIGLDHGIIAAGFATSECRPLYRDSCQGRGYTTVVSGEGALRLRASR